HSGGVAIGVTLVEIDAVKALAILRIEPDARPIHIKRVRRRLGDVAQRVPENAGVNGWPLRQIDEDLVLPSQPAFGLAHQRFDAWIDPVLHDVEFGHEHPWDAADIVAVMSLQGRNAKSTTPALWPPKTASAGRRCR